MEQAPKIENKEKKKISKVHFLIHPGYLHYMGYGYNSEKYKALLPLYINQAKNLGDNELMFAFVHTSKPQLKRDIEAGALYTETLKEIKNILGDRLIVTTGDTEIVHGVKKAKDALSKILRIAEARGYTFDAKVLSEAYGEMLEACVQSGAENLNIAAGLKHKTKVRSELTDFSLLSDKFRFRKGNDLLNSEERRKYLEAE